MSAVELLEILCWLNGALLVVICIALGTWCIILIFALQYPAYSMEDDEHSPQHYEAVKAATAEVYCPHCDAVVIRPCPHENTNSQK